MKKNVGKILALGVRSFEWRSGCDLRYGEFFSEIQRQLCIENIPHCVRAYLGRGRGRHTLMENGIASLEFFLARCSLL